MRRGRLVALAGALAVASFAPATEAQERRPGAMAPQRRERMEQQLRQGVWRIAKARLQLTDEQMRSLEATNARLEPRRRALIEEERTLRVTLRGEVMAGERADQDKVAAALDRMLAIQRQRLDLVTEEQRETARFMTPVQRAGYVALQEQLRRRMESMRQRRAGGGPRGMGPQDP